MPITLVLADDHPIVLQGLAQLFSLEPDFTVLAQCMNGEEALQAVRKHHPDILILDLCMPGKDGLTVLREIQKEALVTKVVILTAALDDEEVLEAIRQDVRGVVLKEMAPQMLVRCVRKVYAGGQWLDQRSLARAMDKLLRREASTKQLATMLTPREIELVRMVASGLRNKEIGAKLSITEGTVKIHLHNIYEKLQVKGRTELVLLAKDKGLM